MTEKFTNQDSRSIAEMLDEYEQLCTQVSSIDRSNPVSLSEEEKAICRDYDNSKHFMSDMRAALDFTRSSTQVVLAENGQRECRSLMENEQKYAEALVLLTGGFDERLQDDMCAIRLPYQSEQMTQAEYEAFTEAPLDLTAVKKAIDTEIGNQNIMQTRSISEVASLIDDINAIRNENDISYRNVMDDTLRVLYIKLEADECFAFGREINDEEKLKPVEIVESNDGYVMNTNQEITVANLDDYNAKVENGNEVIHPETAAFTTIDPAEAGGKVKLEEFDDIGSVEKAQGIPTYEEKALIAEALTATAAAEKIATEKAAPKQSAMEL